MRSLEQLSRGLIKGWRIRRPKERGRIKSLTRLKRFGAAHVLLIVVDDDFGVICVGEPAARSAMAYFGRINVGCPGFPLEIDFVDAFVVLEWREGRRRRWTYWFRSVLGGWNHAPQRGIVCSAALCFHALYLGTNCGSGMMLRAIGRHGDPLPFLFCAFPV